MDPTPPSGQWTAAEPVPGLAPLNVGKVAELNDIACASGGNCAAGGSFTAANGVVQAWIASEVNGRGGGRGEGGGRGGEGGGGGGGGGGGSQRVGNALGQPYQQAFVASEVNGRWGPAAELPAIGRRTPAAWPRPDDLVCVVGDCAAGGSYQNAAGDTGTFVANEVGGTWGAAMPVPGTAAQAAAG